jgi:hypothetical protein
MITPNTLFSIESFTKTRVYPDYGLIRERAASRWAFLALGRGFGFDEVMRELRRYLPFPAYDYLYLSTGQGSFNVEWLLPLS